MPNTSQKSITIRLPSGNWLKAILVLLVIAGSFYVGGLATEVRLLKEGGALSARPRGAVPNQPTQPQPPLGQAGDVDPVTDADWVKGDRSARIALIEYSDLECPFCKSFHPTAQQAVDNYDGDVMWVYRHFPLEEIHPKAGKEAEATECAGKLAGNDGFWALTDKIFEVTPSNNGLDLETLPDLAGEVGLDRNAFESCLNSGEMADTVAAQYESGIRAGVTGTPGNILLDTETGETQLIPGALPYAQVSQAIDQLLAN